MKNITVSDILKATKGSLIRGSEDTYITDISIDSKSIPSDATLFIPLKGERVDAHRFVGGAIANGAIGAVISEESGEFEAAKYALINTGAKVIIKVDDTKKALQNIGAYYRRTRDIKLVGITGSVGKTTTREMTATALKPLGEGNIYQTKGNRNSQTGVPLTLTDIADEAFGVIELGMSEAGEIEVISRLSLLDAAIVTNIGVAHLMQLKTQDNICKEKLSIVHGLKKDGFIFLNGDDPFLRKYSHLIKHKVYFYGEDESCDFRVLDVVQTESGMNFVLKTPDNKYDVMLPVMGMHNVKNAAAAIGVAIIMGAEPKEVMASMASFVGVKMRQQLIKKNGYTIIDDSYNANPDSMKAGLNVLDKFVCEGRRIALLADMKELGDDEVRYHKELGRTVAGLFIDILVTVGSLASNISNEAADINSKLIVKHVSDNKQAADFLREQLKPGDVLFVKGSRSMALDEVIRTL